MNQNLRNSLEVALIATLSAIVASGSMILLTRSRSAQATPPAVEVAASPVEVIGTHPSYLGNSNSSSTLVVFLDYQCPPCRNTEPQLEEFVRKNEGKIKMTIRNFPLKIHPEAFPAALVAESARGQKQYWAIHNQLLRVESLKTPELDNVIASTGLDKRIYQTVVSGLAKDRVQEDINFAKKLKLAGTPSLLLCTPDHKVTQVFSMDQIGHLIQ